MKIYAIVGSRGLRSAGVKLICDEIVSRGGQLVVGCASGVDAAVLSAALAGGYVDSVRCFAAFAAGGAGACGVSAVGVVSAFAAAGGCVSWLAGGGLSVPVRARLAVRAAAVVSAASAGCVGFLASSASVGSSRALSLAAARGLEVQAYPCGFDGEDLPIIGNGRWRQSDDAWVWLPGASLF
jgi:hypothetical protein